MLGLPEKAAPEPDPALFQHRPHASGKRLAVFKVSRFGAVFPQRIVEVVKSTGPVTLEARQTLAALMTSCVMPELFNGQSQSSGALRVG